jgi:tetratricopeptide (TPR) repeat protein
MTLDILRPVLCAIVAITVASCASLSHRDTLTMPYEDRLQLASIYIQSGQVEKAVPLLEDAVNQEGDRPEAWAMLGELFWLKGELKRSSTYLEKALKAGGEDPLILNNLAWVESAKEDHERALALVDRAVAMDPVPLFPYLETRARVLMKLQRYEEALADAGAALSLTPDYDKNMKQQLRELIKEIEEKVQ